MCLDRLVVVDDGPKVDMSVAHDVMPKGVREWQAVSLGLKTADGIFWVEVIHGLEHPSLALCAEIRAASPRGLSPSCTPVPGIVWIVDVIIVAGALGDNPVSLIVIIISEASQVRGETILLSIGIPRHSRRVTCFTPSRSKRDFSSHISLPCVPLASPNREHLSGSDLLKIGDIPLMEESLLEFAEARLPNNDLISLLTSITKLDCLGLICFDDGIETPCERELEFNLFLLDGVSSRTESWGL